MFSWDNKDFPQVWKEVGEKTIQSNKNKEIYVSKLPIKLSKCPQICSVILDNNL